MAPPLSTYFDVPTFRAIDSDATNTQQPLSSALEAQLASSHSWLHVRGAGACPLIKSPAAATQAGYNFTFFTSAVWASVFSIPFLVMRGLTSVKITCLGTIEDYNLRVKLELLGFATTEAVWAIGTTSTTNVVREITLTLPQPAEVEYETDLILWGRSQLVTSGVSTTATVTYAEGQATVGSGVVTTKPNATLASVGTQWEAAGFPPVTVREALFRTATGGSGGTTAVAQLHERLGGTERVAQVDISRLTTRSFFIEPRYS